MAATSQRCSCDVEIFAVLIAQANGWRTIADLFGAAVDTRRGEMRDVLIHQNLTISGHTHPPAGAVFG
jgi:hypothetical protein